MLQAVTQRHTSDLHMGMTAGWREGVQGYARAIGGAPRVAAVALAAAPALFPAARKRGQSPKNSDASITRPPCDKRTREHRKQAKQKFWSAWRSMEAQVFTTGSISREQQKQLRKKPTMHWSTAFGQIERRAHRCLRTGATLTVFAGCARLLLWGFRASAFAAWGLLTH